MVGTTSKEAEVQTRAGRQEPERPAVSATEAVSLLGMATVAGRRSGKSRSVLESCANAFSNWCAKRGRKTDPGKIVAEIVEADRFPETLVEDLFEFAAEEVVVRALHQYRQLGISIGIPVFQSGNGRAEETTNALAVDTIGLLPTTLRRFADVAVRKASERGFCLERHEIVNLSEKPIGHEWIFDVDTGTSN